MAAHLFKRHQRAGRLIFQTLRTRIPEHRRGCRHIITVGIHAVKRRIQHRLGVSLRKRHVVWQQKPAVRSVPNGINAERQIQPIGIGIVGVVAGSAGNVFITGQHRVPEQRPAECNRSIGGGITGRTAHRNGLDCCARRRGRNGRATILFFTRIQGNREKDEYRKEGKHIFTHDTGSVKAGNLIHLCGLSHCQPVSYRHSRQYDPARRNAGVACFG